MPRRSRNAWSLYSVKTSDSSGESHWIVSPCSRPMTLAISSSMTLGQVNRQLEPTLILS